MNIAGITDEVLAFLGYNLADEQEEFKVYRDKYHEDHIVEKARPLLYVEDANDALVLRGEEVIKLAPNMHDVD